MVVIALRAKDGTIIDALRYGSASIIEAVLCLFSLATVGGLACYHTRLLATGVTTNEDIKRTFRSKTNAGVRNPFDRGGCVANCLYMFCSSRSPSLLQSRSFVEVENSNPEPTLQHLSHV